MTEREREIEREVALGHAITGLSKEYLRALIKEHKK